MTLKVIVQAGILVRAKRGVTNYYTGHQGTLGWSQANVPIVITLNISLFLRTGHDGDDLALCPVLPAFL